MLCVARGPQSHEGKVYMQALSVPSIHSMLIKATHMLKFISSMNTHHDCHGLTQKVDKKRAGRQAEPRGRPD